MRANRRCDYHGHRAGRFRVRLPGQRRYGHACAECARRLERKGADVQPRPEGTLFPAA